MITSRTLFSKDLNREVEVRIRRPEKDSKIYLYFFDAQNIFDERSSAYNKSWHVDEVLDELGVSLHVVAISSLQGMERVREYLPGYGGEKTASFLVHEVLPLVEEGEVSHRIIAGSSMGGIMSLYMGAIYPTLFKGVLAMSTAAFYEPETMGEIVSLYKKDNEQKIYLDVGTKESSEISEAKAYVLTNRFLKGALKHHCDLLYVEEQGAVHDETSWHRRLPNALRFLLELEE